RPRTPARAVSGRRSPTADCKSFLRRDRLERKSPHGLAESARHLGNELGIAEMRRRFDDRLRAPRGIGRLENAGAYEVSFRPELHHERRVGGRRDAAGAEEHDRELSVLRYLAHELHRDAVLLGLLLLRVRSKLGELADRVGDRTDMCDRLDDVPGARLAFAANHRRALVDAPQRLAEIASPTHERDLEGVLVDVEFEVRRSQDLALVDVLDADRLEALGFARVVDACTLPD